MLTLDELRDLQRECEDTKVLSVYLATRATDPAMRDAWRPTLHNVIREARALVDDAGAAEFDRAAAFLGDPQPSPGGTWRAPGWMAFVTADGVRYASDLPVAPLDYAVWRTGPVITPYLRALKQARPVLVALVESASARLFRYALGVLEPIEELAAPGYDVDRPGRPTAPSRPGVSASAPRGATGSDAVSRRRHASFDRLVAALGARLGELGDADTWLLIGGSREWGSLAGEALGGEFGGRMLVSPALGHGASDAEIAAAAKHAASELRATRGAALVDQLIEQGGGHARAAVGVPAIQRALRARAVDVLLVTPRFIGDHAGDAEDFTRASIAFGASVDILSGEAADHLDRSAGGVAARLRFAIDEPPATAAAAHR